MKEKIIDAIGHIDDDMIEKTDTLRQKKRYTPGWMKWYAAACLCFVMVGVLSIVHFRDKNIAVETKANLPTSSSDGIYIPAVELPENTDGSSFDMLALVVYRGGIYTQAQSYFGEEAERIDALVGEYLGRATGSINEWSTQDEYAVEFASSVAGDVYAVTGYDTDFRICVRNKYEDGNGEKQLWIEFLDRLNDITLKTGADLFETRLRISDRVAEIKYQYHEDWNWDKGNIQTADIDPELWKEFMHEVDNADFLYTWNSDMTENTIYDTENQAHLSLVLDDGTVVSLRMIEGGYVGYDPMGWFFVKIPGNTFDAVFTACGGSIK